MSWVKSQLLELAANGPLLALDTSGSVTSLCLVTTQVDERLLPASVTPSEGLVQAIAETLDAAQIRGPQLQAIVVGLGPGSFTGLRVGLATAKGLSLGAKVPLVGVSSFATWALSCSAVSYVAPLLDARCDEVFSALYRIDNGSAEVCIADGAYAPKVLLQKIQMFAALENVTFVGDGSAIVKQLTQVRGLTLQPIQLRAACALLIAKDRIGNKQWDDIDKLVPFYLRVSEAERKLTPSNSP
jgi:tRNA threonylcarbamoyladenosine biosynthesis protein TsaB